MTTRLKAFVEALIAEHRDEATRCLSPLFTLHDGLTKQAFIEHEIKEFRRRLLPDECEPVIKVSPLSETEYEIHVVAQGLIYATSFEVDGQGLICSNDNVVECVPKLRHHQNKIARAAALRSPNFPVQMITPKFPVTDYHLTVTPEKGLFSYLHFSTEIEPAQSFIGSLRVMMKDAGSANIKVNFPGLDRVTDWQEKEFFPIIEGNRVKLAVGKSRPWSANAWLEDGSCVSIERPEAGLDWDLGRTVAKAMVTDALDNDWIMETER